MVVSGRLVRVAPHVRGHRGIAVGRLRRRGSGGSPAVTSGQPRARQRRLQVRGQRTVRWERSAVIAEGRRRRRGKPGQKRGLLRRLLLLLLGMMLTMVVVLLLLLLNLTGLLGVVAVVGELVVERLQVLHVLVRVEGARRRRRGSGAAVRRGGVPPSSGGRTRKRVPRIRRLAGIPCRVPVLLRHGAPLTPPPAGKRKGACFTAPFGALLSFKERAAASRT